MATLIPVHAIETRFFERGGEFVLMAYVDDPRTEVLRDLPRKELLSADRIYLVGPLRSVEVDKRLVGKLFPVGEGDLARRARSRLDREYGTGMVEDVLAVRIPRSSVDGFRAEDAAAIRERFRGSKAGYEEAVAALLVSDADHLRLNIYRFWAEAGVEPVPLGLTRAEMARWAWRRLRGRGWLRSAEAVDGCGVAHEVDLVRRSPRAALRCYVEASPDDVDSFARLAEALRFPEGLAVVSGGEARGRGPVRVVHLKDL